MINSKPYDFRCEMENPQRRAQKRGHCDDNGEGSEDSSSDLDTITAVKKNKHLKKAGFQVHHLIEHGSIIFRATLCFSNLKSFQRKLLEMITDSKFLTQAYPRQTTTTTYALTFVL